MAGEAEFFGGNGIVSRAKALVKSIYARRATPATTPAPDLCEVILATGNASLPDIQPVAGTYTLLAPGEFKLQLDVAQVFLDVKGAVAWSGASSTAKTIILQDSAGNEICSYTAAALAGGAQYILPVSSTTTLPTGVSDTQVKLIGATVAAGLGLQVVVANAPTAGSPVRLRIRGYLMA